MRIQGSKFQLFVDVNLLYFRQEIFQMDLIKFKKVV